MVDCVIVRWFLCWHPQYKSGPADLFSEFWMDIIPVYVSCHMLVTPFQCTMWVLWRLYGQDLSVLIVSHDCQTLLMHPQDMWKILEHIHCMCFFTYQYTTTLEWLSGLAVLTKYNDTAWVLWSLDEQDPSAWIVSQDCCTLPMHPQDMRNGW